MSTATPAAWSSSTSGWPSWPAGCDEAAGAGACGAGGCGPGGGAAGAPRAARLVGAAVVSARLQPGGVRERPPLPPRPGAGGGSHLRGVAVRRQRPQRRRRRRPDAALARHRARHRDPHRWRRLRSGHRPARPRSERPLRLLVSAAPAPEVPPLSQQRRAGPGRLQRRPGQRRSLDRRHRGRPSRCRSRLPRRAPMWPTSSGCSGSTAAHTTTSCTAELRPRWRRSRPAPARGSSG